MTRAKPEPVRRSRCAIYTRKSSEEGLEQEFNSLHAQREACEAYIASQRAEGWACLRDHYDDGGFSGGTLDRPALKQLITDIEAGLIDVVVVYKIDRLSRALMDFSKLVEIFDRNSVTFVSVTQSFNTTTSMGRLTLNILLSFAQFEREVIGERIRDKFAASRKKGMWMGGFVPLGYDVKDRKLVVNAAEADPAQRQITAATFGRACHFLEAYALPMARRAYGAASVPTGERTARRLAGLIRDEGWNRFTARDVQRMQRAGLTSAAEIRPALTALEEADLVHAVPRPARPGKGRPTKLFTVNPIIHEARP